MADTVQRQESFKKIILKKLKICTVIAKKKGGRVGRMHGMHVKRNFKSKIV
jgi:hypothetical protein